MVNTVVTSRQNNNNRTSGLGYSPQSIGSTETSVNKFTIYWLNRKVSSFMGGEPAEGNKAFYNDEVEALKKSS